MALTRTLLGTGQNTTAQTSTSFLVGASVAVGELLVVVVGSDNSVTGGTSPMPTTISDNKGNTYVRRQTVVNNPSSTANTGAAFAVYTSNVTVALVNTDTVTVNWSASTTSKSAILQKVTAAAGSFPRYRTGGTLTGTSALPSMATGSITSAEAVICGLALESNTTVTGDADTLNGSWTAVSTSTANTGTAGTSMGVTTQAKIVTATGAQTYNPTLGAAANTALAWIAVTETANSFLAKTASGSNTTTVATTSFSTRPRTAADTGLGTSTATGVVSGGFATVSRTASGSNTTTVTTNAFVTRPRTASGTNATAVSTSKVTVRPRTATGVGIGTAVTTGIKVRLRTATGSNTTAVATTKVVIRPRTASGTGSGTATSTGSVIGGVKARTASGTGAGSATASRVVVRLRTATGSNTTSVATTKLVVRPRTASGLGAGSTSIASATIVRLRTADGVGTGSATAVVALYYGRTAFGVGVGSSYTSNERIPLVLVSLRAPKHRQVYYPVTMRPHTRGKPLRPPKVRW